MGSVHAGLMAHGGGPGAEAGAASKGNRSWRPSFLVVFTSFHQPSVCHMERVLQGSWLIDSSSLSEVPISLSLPSSGPGIVAVL